MAGSAWHKKIQCDNYEFKDTKVCELQHSCRRARVQKTILTRCSFSPISKLRLGYCSTSRVAAKFCRKPSWSDQVEKRSGGIQGLWRHSCDSHESFFILFHFIACSESILLVPACSDSQSVSTSAWWEPRLDVLQDPTFMDLSWFVSRQGSVPKHDSMTFSPGLLWSWCEHRTCKV